MAALEHIQTLNQIVKGPNPTLTQLLTDPLSSKAIKPRFIKLAKDTGKLKDLDTSWSNAIGDINRRLKKNSKVDNAFKALTKEKAKEIFQTVLLEIEKGS
jgi:hypothetical protein